MATYHFRKFINVSVTRGMGPGYYVDDEHFKYLGQIRKDPAGKGWLYSPRDTSVWSGPVPTREDAGAAMEKVLLPPPQEEPGMSPYNCFVAVYSIAWVGLGTPDRIFYKGPSDEEQAQAQAEAEDSIRLTRVAYPQFTFSVMSLSDFISEYARQARDEGRRDAQDNE